MAESGSVDDQDAVRLREPVQHAAGLEVVAMDHVPVQQQDRWAFAGDAVVQPHAVDVDETTLGRVAAFGATGRVVDPCGRAEGGGRDGRRGVPVGTPLLGKGQDHGTHHRRSRV